MWKLEGGFFEEKEEYSQIQNLVFFYQVCFDE